MMYVVFRTMVEDSVAGAESQSHVPGMGRGPITIHWQVLIRS